MKTRVSLFANSLFAAGATAVTVFPDLLIVQPFAKAEDVCNTGLPLGVNWLGIVTFKKPILSPADALVTVAVSV